MKRKRLERPKRTPIAKPVNAGAGERKGLKNVVQEIRALRKGATLGKIKIRELIDEGHRY